MITYKYPATNKDLKHALYTEKHFFDLNFSSVDEMTESLRSARSVGARAHWYDMTPRDSSDVPYLLSGSYLFHCEQEQGTQSHLTMAKLRSQLTVLLLNTFNPCNKAQRLAHEALGRMADLYSKNGVAFAEVRFLSKEEKSSFHDAFPHTRLGSRKAKATERARLLSTLCPVTEATLSFYKQFLDHRIGEAILVHLDTRAGLCEELDCSIREELVSTNSLC